MANPHPFIIPILWVCILCLLRCFAMHLLYMDLNSMYMHMLLYLYCSMLFNECICAFICHNIKEKKYIYKYIY